MVLPDNIREVMANAECLFTSAQVEQAIDNLAHSITENLADKNPIVYCVMNGGIVLTGKLLTKLGFPLELSYLHATRYRDRQEGATLEWKAFPFQDMTDRTVLIVDDIYDEGETLGAIVDHCKERGVKDIHMAVLVDKQHNRKKRRDIVPNYIGLQCEDRFVFGSGMDYEGYWRNASGIFAVKAT